MAPFPNPLPPQRGFTYIWLLLAIALTTVGLAAVAEVASTAIRRDKEAELLFVGNQYVRAIALYNASTPSGAQQYPQRLEDLLADKRFPNVRRYLRRVYPDPMTGSAEWGLIRGPNGGITGVQSRSTAQPLKKANFPKEYEAFAGAATYRDWVFAFAPPAGAPPGAPGAPGAPKQGGSSSVLTPLIPSAPAGSAPGASSQSGSSSALTPLIPSAPAGTVSGAPKQTTGGARPE
jgi:type II secretory pathway pseudopilin PulG